MEKNRFDLYRILGSGCVDEDTLKATFVCEPLWHGNRYIDKSAIIATLDENEPFAVIYYYYNCNGVSKGSYMCDEYLVDVNNARNKEWVKNRLKQIVDNCKLGDDFYADLDETTCVAEVTIYECFTNQNFYYNDKNEKVWYDFADINEIENFEIKYN